jgi:hypothetical protein
MNWFYSKRRTVATVGLQGHGKTVFLAGLFRDSFFTLADTLRPFSVRAATAKADDVFYGNALTLDGLELPPANPRGRPEAAVLEFSNVPRAGGRRQRDIQLTFFDIAGEVFAGDQTAAQYAPFLADADDIIFLFDPTHEDFSALGAARLVDLVSRVALKGRRKNLIVALSKMDELRLQDGWAEVIGDLWPDAPPAPADLPAYFRQMERLSEMLRLWWSDPAREAQNLMNSLSRDVRFCAVSSIGHQPLWDCAACGAVNAAAGRECTACRAARANVRLRLARRPEPFRVRDPLFWVFRAAGVM